LEGENKADIRRLAEAYGQASAILYSIIETAPAVAPFAVLLNNQILHRRAKNQLALFSLPVRRSNI